MPDPRYPVFVPSKGRADACYTARFLTADAVPFRLLVEAQEADAYRAAFPDAELLVLPFRDLGSVVPARNHIREVAEAEGHARHWQLDDNIRGTYRLYRSRILPAHSGTALAVCEDFTDRYTNVGISGLNYEMFVTEKTRQPYTLNCHVYSCSLINHEMPYPWRGRYNEDTDLCLQALTGGWCTIALNVFVADKIRTMMVKGGNTDALSYQADGRAHMARSLERQWPHVVTTKRRFGRPQHVIRGTWAGFDTPLQRRTDIDWDNLPKTNEYGLQLTQVADEVRSPRIRQLLSEANLDTS